MAQFRVYLTKMLVDTPVAGAADVSVRMTRVAP